MTLDIYTKQDVMRVLLALEFSTETTLSVLEAAVEPEDCKIERARHEAYGKGYRAALASIALAFGLQEAKDGQGTNKKLLHGSAIQNGTFT